MKPIGTQEKAVIRKDFHEVWDFSMARSTLLAVPLILVVAVPIMFLVITCKVPTDQINGIDKLMKLLPAEAKGYSVQQASFYVMTNMMFPMFFLMIPLMVSSVSAATSFVGERERGTLETLILTPMSLQQIFRAKVLGCILLSAIITSISFFAFSIVITVGDIILQMPFFLNWNWLVLILFFAPAVTVFGVVFMVLVSAKSKSYIESVQTSGYIILPLLFLFLGEFTGLFLLNAIHFLIISAVIIALDAVIWGFAARSFQPEKLLK